jgi:glycosyltransferase involved in cell wall biosynthesis
VHTHTSKAGVLGRLAAATCGVPVRVHTFHGHFLYGFFPSWKTKAYTQIERALALTSHRLVAIGEQVREEMLAARIGARKKYVVMAPGARIKPLPDRQRARKELGLPPDGPVVAYVGRVTKTKRPDLLAEVARIVRRSNPDVRFAVCGGGDLLGELKRTADETGMHLLGWRGDVETVFAAADIVLSTSANEGMPVSLMEAGMAGLPVVATRVGSVAEVVTDGVTGLLAAPDADQLAAHVLTLLGDDQARRRMGEAAKAKTLEEFSRERMVARTAELYESLVPFSAHVDL